MLGVLSLFLPQALGDGRDAVVGELLGTQWGSFPSASQWEEGEEREASTAKMPLGCMLRHFKEGFSDNVYGIKFSKGRLRTLCESEWPTFSMGRPDTDLLTLLSPKLSGREGNPEAPAQGEQSLSFSPPTTQSRTQAREGSTGDLPPEGSFLPLREAPHKEGNLGGQPFLVYVPFSMSDLYNWKT
ncbi:hypothetical protein QTO34_012321 [Cnephaeus nilssonii]|uniref:Uncharacterized protein n=1 Tax=Cnephaeus nilssonii TaxID=3371016 RepID=A0AA40HDL7_CNENI|nr:hypothetical protein QTO34_012321 [Eptesicus nilssonii]